MNRIQLPIFQLDDIQVSYGKNNVLKIGNFKFHRGTIYGIVGTVGSGKTTLLNLLRGEINPNEGSVLYEDNPFERSFFGKLKPIPEIIFFGDYPSNSKLSVKEKISSVLPERSEQIRKKYYSSSQNSSSWTTPINKQSPGQEKRMEMIIGAESDPKILMIDNYGNYFDSQMKREMNHKFKNNAKKRGTTVILTTTDIERVRHVSSVLIFLDNGHISKIRSLAKQ